MRILKVSLFRHGMTMSNAHLGPSSCILIPDVLTKFLLRTMATPLVLVCAGSIVDMT